MMPFDAYKCYLSLKNHFTKDKYDYHKYNGKTRATVQSFYKRKDRYWFEKLSRSKSDKEVVDFFVSNFITCTDPSKSGHPTVLKKYLGGDVSIETMIILDKILGYRKQFDNKLTDPVWESVSMKMKKYEPFLNIDVFRYKKVLKQKVLGE